MEMGQLSTSNLNATKQNIKNPNLRKINANQEQKRDFKASTE